MCFIITLFNFTKSSLHGFKKGLKPFPNNVSLWLLHRHCRQRLRTGKGGHGMVTKATGHGNHMSTERSTIGEQRVNRVIATYIYTRYHR